MSKEFVSLQNIIVTFIIYLVISLLMDAFIISEIIKIFDVNMEFAY